MYSNLYNIHDFNAIKESILLDVIIGDYDEENYKISFFKSIDDIPQKSILMYTEDIEF